MSERPEVSVIVVSYNAQEWLERCLASVPAACEGLSHEVVVVDNASEEPLRRWLASRPHSILLLQQAENLGFARGCNVGVTASAGRRVLLLNPDAELRPGAVTALVSYLDDDPGRGIVGGRTLRPGPPGSPDVLDPRSCWGRPTLWSWFCAAVGLSRVLPGSRLFDPESLGTWQRDSPREVDIVSGCLLMADRSVWDALDGMDEQFFLYAEDADLSLRARDAGWRPSITPDAQAVHALSATSPDRLSKQRLLLRGKATLARKRWTPARAALGTGLLVLGVGLRATAEAATRSPGRTWRTLWQERRVWSVGYPGPGDRSRAPTAA